MSNVTDWDPVDDANTDAPPHGWPEFMQPSAVNNTGRMMMGAVRRMYDGQMSGAIALPYLPLATGGTVHGAVFVDAVLTGATVNSNGSMNAATSISAGGAISAGTTVTGPGGFFGSGWAISGSGGNVSFGTGTTGNLASLTLYANTVSVQGNIGATGNVGGSTLSASGAISAGGNIGGNTLSAAGAISAGSNISAGGNVAIGGVGYVGGIPFANVAGWFKAYAGGQFDNVQSNGFITAAGSITVGDSVWAANNAGQFGLSIQDGVDYSLRFRSDCFLRFQNSTANLWWQLGPTIGVWAINANGFCHADAGAVGGNGAYVNFSDENLKTDIEPAAQGLDIVLGLQPMKFRRRPREGMPEPRLEVGFVAQQVQSVFPEAVVEVQRVADPAPVLGLDDGAIVAALVGAVKTLEARLAALEGRP